MYQEFKGRALFYVCYIREAHPGSKLYFLKEGTKVLEVIGQTNSIAERRDRAKQTVDSLNIGFPTVVDTDDKAASAAYAGWPVRYAVVAKDGTLLHKGNMGPWGFWAKELKRWLEENPL